MEQTLSSKEAERARTPDPHQIHRTLAGVVNKRKKKSPEEQAAELEQLMKDLAEMLGGSVAPALRDICESVGLDASFSCLDAGLATVRDAAQLMAKTGRAVLAVREGMVVGIVSPKELLNCIAKKGGVDLNLDSTLISAIMSTGIEPVDPDSTIVETLWHMHDGRCLHVPVVESDHTILGVIDVFSLMHGIECSDGKGGWRAFLAAAGETEMQQTPMAMQTPRPHLESTSGQSISGASFTKGVKVLNSRTVGKLRPRKALTVHGRTSIRKVSQQMRERKTDCVLVMSTMGTCSPQGGSDYLAGILTDKDLCSKVVADGLDP
jgi:signal-transduction protein with cAMP-binding, CBS, and nucleotidyltransferase domain